MAFLEKLSPEDRDLVVSLPYRAGLWMSKADTTGDAQSSKDEVAVLEDIIERQSRGMFGSAFVHEVMAELFARQKDWTAWGQGLDAVPDQMTRAVSAISAGLSPRDAEIYARNILDIAYSVAMAYREFDLTAPLAARVQYALRKTTDHLLSAIRGYSVITIRQLNISAREQDALTTLSKAAGLAAAPPS